MISANRLRETREQTGVSQGDLAKQLGVTRQTISNWERGAREPRTQTWESLSRVLNVPTAYLIGLEEKEGVEPFVVAMNDKKVSIYEDDLKRIYDLANSIKGLALDRAQNPYFLLGFASGRADTIRMIIRSATCDGIGGKEKPNDN